jgi:serine protease Do
MNRAVSTRRCGAVWLLMLGISLVSAAPAQAQWESYKSKPFLRTNPKFLEVFRPVVASAGRSTVRVQCDDEDVALGTIVGADGWILTKASDLGGKIVCRLKDGREFEAYIVGVHEGHDLALLRIKAQHLPVVEWRTSKEDAVGNWVASVGMGEQPATVGVISVAARKLPDRLRPVALVGGYLGVGLEPAEAGVRIIEVMKNTAAIKAKLRVNDLVLSVSGKAVDSVESLQGALQKYKAGDMVTVRIKRGDEELDIRATLGKRPPARADLQNSMGSKLSERRSGFLDILQHDSVVKPEDCGGPLVDLDGKVIGINICRAGRTESYAVPAEVIQPLLSDLMSGRLAPRPMATTTTAK